MDDTVIKVENVSKKYCRTLKHTMWYGATDLVRSFSGINQHTEKLRRGEFWAVDNVSFEVKRGETIGLIGSNGSGKSTLLKMLNGIFMPDKGKIEINGKVGALIEVGAGFHPMLTGRENVYVNGAILGMSKKEMNKKFEDIVDFADIGDFLDSPVKHYSAGMYVRLGFSTAVHCEPNILLVDEVLAVGDFNFQNKFLERFKNFKSKGKTIILVSHDPGIVKNFCDRAIWIEKGQNKKIGHPKDAVDAYLDASRGKSKLSSGMRKNYFSSKEVEITRFEITGQEGEGKDVYPTGERLHVKVEYKANTKISRPLFGLSFTRNDNILVYATSSENDGMSPEEIHGRGYLEIIFDPFPLVTGTYTITLAIYDTQSIRLYAQANEVFRMQTEDKTWGICRLRPRYIFQNS